MRTRTRLVTTAGVTVLGLTAMSGMAQADTSGLGLSGLTSPLTNTLGGVVNQVVPASKSSTRGLNLPVHVHLKVPLSNANTARRDPGQVRTEAARSRGSLATADVDAALNASPRGLQARANVGLCASLAEECGAQQNPPSQPPGQPPPPGRPPQAPGGNAPSATGSITAVHGGSLPFTGGPIGSLAFLGALSVLTGAAGISASRMRVRRES